MSDEQTRSVWINTEVAPRASSLDQALTADTVMVGSGIAGLSTAYELAPRGHDKLLANVDPDGEWGQET